MSSGVAVTVNNFIKYQLEVDISLDIPNNVL